ncbi:MAG: hypothetical protein A2Y14_02600 [Verrucomicrobia bacterium GWF2_51_19]|nr:MAG: hypothetical protein A2Y14_02600 [Verrucomicrobia bacterium GWF2_51_19]HCJ11616.1 hypothetical protein [Opitutae bacterium]
MQNVIKARFALGAAAPRPPRMLTHPLFKSGYEVSKGAGPALPLRQVVLAQSQALMTFFTGLYGSIFYERKDLYNI